MTSSQPWGDSPPHSGDLEQEVVAAMLIHDDAVPFAASLLEPSDFYLARHRVVFEALVAVHKTHGTADMVLLKDHLESVGHWHTMGGHQGLSQLMTRQGYTGHLEQYAEALLGYSLQRRIIAGGMELEALGTLEDQTQEERLEAVDAVVRGIYQEAGASELAPATQCVREHMDTVDQAAARDGLVGLPSGLRHLDRELGGLRPGWQVLIMAASGVGKSAFAINNLALATLRAGHPVAVFSLEMTRQEVVGRLIAAVSGVPYHVQTRGRMDDDDRLAYEEAVRIVEHLPVYVDEGDMLTIEKLSIRARALQHRLGRPLGLVVVDYIQLLESGSKTGNRTQELSTMSRGLKRLAKALGTVVVTLSQPTVEGSRATKAGERNLTLADARGAQSIGADVDLALLINRNQDKGTLTLEAGKYRHGPTFALTEQEIRWRGAQMMFTDRYI